MATCFDNIISYKGTCSGIVPTSGLYTDQVGLHKEEIEKYLQAPYQNADEFFEDIKLISINEIKTNIYQNFLKRYKAASIINDARLGDVSNNMESFDAAAGKLRGVEIDLCNHVSPINFYLSEFSLFIDVTATVTIQVWDLKQNKQIDSFTVDAVANEITTVYPAKTYKANRKPMDIAFLYDVSLYDQYQITLPNSSCGTCVNGSYVKVNSWMTARGVEFASGDSKTTQNITSINHTAGISFVYSIQCNHEDWICSHANFIAPAILHKTVANILDYGLKSSTRENSQTIIDRDLHQKRIDAHEFKYREMMDNIIQNISPPQDPVCYVCSNRVISKVVLP